MEIIQAVQYYRNLTVIVYLNSQIRGIWTHLEIALGEHTNDSIPDYVDWAGTSVAVLSCLPPSSFSSTNLTAYSFHCLNLIPCYSIYSSQHFVGFLSFLFYKLRIHGIAVNKWLYRCQNASQMRTEGMFSWAWTSLQQVSQARHDLDDMKREKKKTSSCREIHFCMPQNLPLTPQSLQR